MPHGKDFSIRTNDAVFGVPLAGEMGVKWRRYIEGGHWRCPASVSGAHRWVYHEDEETRRKWWECKYCLEEQEYQQHYVEGWSEQKEGI